jgi:hypothetical protein
MSLSDILASGDAKTQSRGISLFFSILATSPLKILNLFQQFSEFLLTIKGPALETINVLIVESILKHASKIDNDSISHLINYICYLLENPNLVEKISFEQDIEVFTKMYISAISLLLEGKPIDFCFPERVRTLAVTNDHSFIKEIGDNRRIYDLIVKNQRPCVFYLISCLINDDVEISDYAANILIELIQKEKGITNYLYDYSAILSSEKRPASNIKIRAMIEQSSNGVTRGTASHEPFNVTLKPVIVHTHMFAHVEPEEASKLLRKVKVTKKDHIITQSFLKRAKLQLPDALIKTERAPTKEEKGDLPICQMLKKLGKLYWQDRWFEFYPRSSCLLWRSKPDAPEVKGVMIFDHTYSIEQIRENGKFILTLTPQNGKKYLIQFSSKEDLDYWTELISNAIKLE